MFNQVEIQHLNIRISGQVQGVFFRQTATQEAKKLGIKGFVRNEPDGTVYIEAEGSKKILDEFIKWCHEGPEAADVSRVEVNGGQVKKFTDFRRDFADY